MKDIRVTIVHRASITRITWVPGITRIAGVPDVAVVPEVLIYHHIFVQLTNVTTGELVHMCAIELPDGCAAQSVNIAAANKYNRVSSAVIDVVCHMISSNAKEISHGRVAWQTR